MTDHKLPSKTQENASARDNKEALKRMLADIGNRDKNITKKFEENRKRMKRR